MNGKNKLRAIVLLIFIVSMLAGCSRSPEGVRLASDRKMVKRCTEAYGACEMTGVSSGEHEKIYTMLDKDKSFSYSARTYARTIWLDTVLGYTEDWSSDFSERYLNEFLDAHNNAISEIETEYAISFDFDCYVWLCEARGEDLDWALGACEKLDGVLSGWDDRGHWNEFEIRILIGGADNGIWRHGTGYMAPLDTLAEWFMIVAASEIIGTVDDLEFIRLETVVCADLDGYAEIQDDLMNILGSDNRTKIETDIAWFRYKNSIYWIADLCYQDEAGHIRHLGDFPSRYD